MADYFTYLSLAGTAVFALSGALMALRLGLDFIGICLIATVTGVGGGTFRDLLLGNVPVDWVKEPAPITICICCALLVCLLNKKLSGSRLTWLLYADAAGMALFAVMGARAAMDAGAHPLVAILFGAMSASLGGVLRDVICNQTPILLKQEIYISAAAFGALLYIILPSQLGDELRAAMAIIPTFIIRILAIQRNWSFNFPKRIAPKDEDEWL